MRDKNQAAMRTLRAIKAAFLLAKTEKGASGELADERATQILQKLAKQRKESMEIYEKQNRQDLFDKEKDEIEVIEMYLPKQIGDDELREILTTVIAETGATDMKSMGQVMGMASKKLAGSADNKKISQIVRELLS